MVGAVAAELIIADIVDSGNQPKRVRLDEDAPVARLGADRAVALAGALGKVDIGLVAHRAAMAAAVIGLQHCDNSCSLGLVELFGAKVGAEATGWLLPPCCQ